MPTKTSEIKRLHFTIEGEWFTWFLRHLWVEGNETKALRAWLETFPDLATLDVIKSHFIKIVGGKAKFTGTSDSPGYQFGKDNTRYWSTVLGGEPNKQFPLLDSFEDVLLLKKAKLYLAELDLRNFRLNRMYGETHEDVSYNSLKWLDASTENRIENNLRQKVNTLYTDIRNLSRLSGLDLQFDLIPEKAEKLDTKAFYSKGIGFKETGDTGISDGLALFYSIMKTITPWDLYFKKKYGIDMLFINEEKIREMCGCSSEKVEYYQKMPNVPSDEEIIAKVQSIIPGLNLDKYISSMIKESHRETIISENVKRTEWTSGYIDRSGLFYGCADINHVNFSKDICKQFNFGDVEDEKFDAQIYLDQQGWCKVSISRFNWDENIELTQSQKDTIYDYMRAKKIEKTSFNISKELSYEEAFKEDV